MNRIVTLFVCASLMLAAVGCGGGSTLKLYPVTGTVTKSGKPVPGISVTLVPPDNKSSPPLLGATNDEGYFNIKTGNGQQGAPEGTYKVIIVAPTEVDYANPGRGPKAKIQVPKEYASANTATHTIDVKRDGENKLNIEL